MVRIVVLGSGFAGTYTTRHLDKIFRHDDDIEITLISRNNYMVFTPLLPEVSGNIVEPRHAVPPLRGFLRKATFQQAEVRGVELRGQRVMLEYPDGREGQVPYDYLVIALGGVTNYHHAPGANAQSFDLKSLDDAIRLRNHVLLMLEQADVTTDPAVRQEMLTFIGAGGGYAGIEGLGMLIDFVKKALRFYPSISQKDVRFMLASRGNRLLDEIDERLSRYVVHKLSERGVDIRLGVTVRAVTDRTAVLDPGGSVPTRTVLWAAGTAVSPLVKSLDLPHERNGALKVTPSLQVAGHPNIFALGDCAAVPSKTGTYAPTAQNATREGKFAAQNIAALIRGDRLKAFHFRPIGSLASIGHYQAVAQIAGIPFSGFPAWLAWRAVYLAKLPDFTRQVRIALDWLLEMLLPADTVQLPVLPSDDIQAQEATNESGKPDLAAAARDGLSTDEDQAAQQISDSMPEAPAVPHLEQARGS